MLIAPDGRPYGCYVYMLLCQDEGPVYVKVGMSGNPKGRLQGLVGGCAVTPWQFATVRVATRQRACALEREMLLALHKWRGAGEWFKVPMADRAEFNVAWRVAIEAFQQPAWPLKWSVVPVQTILKQANRRRLLKRKWYARLPLAARDAYSAMN